MDIERQIIGSLIIDADRFEDLKLINSEMFKDPMLGNIFSIYEHADGKEVNPFVISAKLKNEFFTQEDINKLLALLASEHDASITDEFCEEQIFKEYKAKKLKEILNHNIISADTVDEILSDIVNAADGFNKSRDEDIVSLADLTKLQGNYFKEQEQEKFDFGFEELDKAVGGLDCGDVAIIAARPAVGKSAFVLQVIREYGRKGFKVGYFNLEMSKKQIYERSIASASGIDMTRIRLATNFLNSEKELFDKGNEILSQEKNVYVVSGTQTIKKIRAIQKRYKFDVIVVDYMQLIAPSSSRGNRASEVGDISRGLKAIATDFNIPVIALSQLNRLSDKTTEKEPFMSELRESGDIEQDASVIIMLWNSNTDDATEKTIKVEKSRNGFNDRVTVYFDGKHMRFTTDGATDFEAMPENEDLPW